MASTFSLTWLGTNSFKVKTPETEFLVDPFVCLDKAEHRNSLRDFLDVPAIFITHGHFDHLCHVPLILKRQPTRVFCTERPAASLLNALISSGTGKDEAKELCRDVVTIAPGSEFDFDDVHVRVFQGKHIRFDLGLSLKTLLPSNIARAPKNVPHILKLHPRYPEGGQTILYDMESAGKHIQFLGSLDLADVEYPRNADLLVMPYQGRSDMVPSARKVIRRLKPKRILLSHFDNTYPPLTHSIDTGGLEKMMREEFPEIGFTIPQFRASIQI
ncbi:MAG: MBL fold metallo-hydrolase [Eubacterium sp.]|nr:MBL fold metallo-hydrolase [Eubacterium sp.]